MTGSVCPGLGDRSHSRPHEYSHKRIQNKQIRGLGRNTHAHMPCTYRDRHTQKTRIYTSAHTYTDTSGSTKVQETSRDANSSLEGIERGASIKSCSLLCCFINRRTLKIASRTLSDVVNRVRLCCHHTVRCSNSLLSRHHARCHLARCGLSKQSNAKQSNTTHGYTQAHVHRYRQRPKY